MIADWSTERIEGPFFSELCDSREEVLFDRSIGFDLEPPDLSLWSDRIYRAVSDDVHNEC